MLVAPGRLSVLERGFVNQGSRAIARVAPGGVSDGNPPGPAPPDFQILALQIADWVQSLRRHLLTYTQFGSRYSRSQGL